MNTQEIIEGNTLIAKFMGLRMGGQSLLTFIIEDGQEVFPKDLKYRESFRGISPVVEKILHTAEWERYEKEVYQSIVKGRPPVDSLTESFYTDAVAFIKWYNQQQQNP
jgi:hypothetical protein